MGCYSRNENICLNLCVNNLSRSTRLVFVVQSGFLWMGKVFVDFFVFFPPSYVIAQFFFFFPLYNLNQESRFSTFGVWVWGGIVFKLQNWETMHGNLQEQCTFNRVHTENWKKKVCSVNNRPLFSRVLHVSYISRKANLLVNIHCLNVLCLVIGLFFPIWMKPIVELYVTDALEKKTTCDSLLKSSDFSLY